MAQTNLHGPQYNHRDIANQQPSISNSFVVVDQQPRIPSRQAFPYSLHLKWVLWISIFKCILGSLLLITGIFEVALLKYYLKIGFAIWCGMTILANGIVGCVLKCKQNKCLIGAFLALSITSFIFDISMLSFYSALLDYFSSIASYYCSSYYYPNYHYYCYGYMSRGDKELGIGLTASLVALVCCEFIFSICSIVVSCKAYSKCCNTCDANDCCMCLGCGECDSHPLDTQEGSPQSFTNQNIPMMSPIQPGALQYSRPNQPHLNTNAQTLPACNATGAQNNPCSGLVSFVINMPSYIFRGADGAQLSAVNVTVQPVPSSQPDFVTQSPGNFEPVPAITVAEAQ